MAEVLLGPPARCPFTVSFLGKGSPTKIDNRKKGTGYPYSNLSTRGPSLAMRCLVGHPQKRWADSPRLNGVEPAPTAFRTKNHGRRVLSAWNETCNDPLVVSFKEDHFLGSFRTPGLEPPTSRSGRYRVSEFEARCWTRRVRSCAPASPVCCPSARGPRLLTSVSAGSAR